MKEFLEGMKRRKLLITLVFFFATMAIFFYLNTGEKYEKNFSIIDKLTEETFQPTDLTFEKIKRKKKDSYEKENERKTILGEITLGDNEQSKEDLDSPFTWIADESEETHFLVTMKKTQKISTGQSLIELVLVEDAIFGDTELKKGTLFLATAIFKNNRCHLFITAYKMQKNKTRPIELIALDEDYQEGVYIEQMTDDMYDYAEQKTMEEIIKRANFKEITSVARDLYRIYRKRSKITLSKKKKFYVKENKKKDDRR